MLNTNLGALGWGMAVLVPYGIPVKIGRYGKLGRLKKPSVYTGMILRLLALGFFSRIICLRCLGHIFNSFKDPYFGKLVFLT